MAYALIFGIRLSLAIYLKLNNHLPKVIIHNLVIVRCKKYVLREIHIKSSKKLHRYGFLDN